MEEQDSFHFSLPVEWNQTANKTPHQSQEEEEHSGSGSLALTTQLGPSTPALVNAARYHCPCDFSCSTSPPR